jgi:RNA polymerase sigma-70 factor, ECF subfamily
MEKSFLLFQAAPPGRAKVVPVRGREDFSEKLGRKSTADGTMTVETARFESDSPYVSNTEAELIAQVQRGNDSAFDALVERHERALYGMAYYLTGQHSDAEDIVQETFLAAFERIRSFEGRSSLKTWLARILMNRAARHHRSRRVRQAAQPVRLSDASRAVLQGAARDQIHNDDIRMDVLAVLQTLKPEHREILVLRELEGMNYQEIASVLELPDGTVESRLFRARQELKDRLKAYVE